MKVEPARADLFIIGLLRSMKAIKHVCKSDTRTVIEWCWNSRIE